MQAKAAKMSSTWTVAISGARGVGKSSFINAILKAEMDGLEQELNLPIFERIVPLKIYEDKFYLETKQPAKTQIFLFNLSDKESLDHAIDKLKAAVPKSPVSSFFIVGTHKDLRDQRKMGPEATVSMDISKGIGASIPYFEIDTTDFGAVCALFHEIIAIPYCSREVFCLPPSEAEQFAVQAMEWCLRHREFRILTHLHSLGYSIPPDIVVRHASSLGAYLMDCHPLQSVPDFEVHDLTKDSFLYEEDEEGELCDQETAMQVEDSRKPLSIKSGWLLKWCDLSLHKCPVKMILAPLSAMSNASLVVIDLSHNKLTEMPVEVFCLPFLKALNISFNEISRLPHPGVWQEGPEILLAAHNFIDHFPCNQAQVKAINSNPKYKEPKLWYADLSHNEFSSLPQSLLICTNLQNLNLEGNAKLKTISPSVTELPRLVNLILSSETVVDPPSFVVSKGTKAVLSHLKSQLAGVVPWNRFRVVLLGPKMAGKSALINVLRDPLPNSKERKPKKSKKGIVIHEWQLLGGEYLRRSCVNLDVWEFEECFEQTKETLYYAFPCRQSVHILVFDIDKAPSGVLKVLAEVQAHSPHPVPTLVVFTHWDTTNRDRRDALRRAWRNLIETGRDEYFEEKFEFPNSLLLPQILGIHFVSTTSTLDGILALRKQIQRLFFHHKEFPLNPKHTVGLGVSVPKQYLAVCEAVHQIRLQERKASSSKRIPLLTLVRVQKLTMELRPGLKQGDIEPALWYLHEVGIIYMFQLEGNAVTVCLDPSLLADLFVKLVKAYAVQDSSKPVGTLLPIHLRLAWGTELVGIFGVSPRLMMSALQTFRVFCPVNSNMIVSPRFLSVNAPPDPTSDLGFSRVYHLDYLPQSLMPNYLCALLSKLTGPLVVSFSPREGSQSDATENSLQASKRFDDGALTFVVAEQYRVTMWSSAVLLEYSDDAGMRVNLDEGCVCSGDYAGSVVFTCWGPAHKQARLFRLAAGTMDATLSEWYPGLLADHKGFAASVCVRFSNVYSPNQTKASRSPPGCLSQLNELPFTDDRHGKVNYSLYDLLKRFLKVRKVFILVKTYSFEDLLPDYACSELQDDQETQLSQDSSNMKDGGVSDGYYVCNYQSNFQDAVMDTRKINPDIRKTLKLGAKFEEFHDFLAKLKSICSQTVTSVLSFAMTPPSLTLERPPCGSLRDLLQRGTSTLQISDVHVLTLRVLAAVEYLHELGVRDVCICSEHILVWNTSPIFIKLSHETAPPQPHSCQMCIEPRQVSPYSEACRDKESILQLAILLYELATRKRPFEGIFTTSFVISAILHGQMSLNIEAQLIADASNLKGNPTLEGESPEAPREPIITGCHRMCLQSLIDSCMVRETARRPTLRDIRNRLCLCVGASPWAPCRMCVSVECVHCSGNPLRVYWASGSRGLIVGHFNPDTGKNFRHIILEAPVPTSGMFANRKGKPVPLAVGHATCLTVVKATDQLWVGTENGSKGSLHVFDVTDWSNHHSIHLQDAVLSLLALNDAPVAASNPALRYRVFAGLANGTIVIFTGMHKGAVASLPLHAQRHVVLTQNRGPCLHMTLEVSGERLWYSRGNSVEVIDSVTLQPISKLSGLQTIQSPVQANLLVQNRDSGGGGGGFAGGEDRERSIVSASLRHSFSRTTSISYKPRPEMVLQVVATKWGVWSFTRRSGKVYCWDLEGGKLKAVYDTSEAIGPSVSIGEVTALRAQSGVLWVGSSAGYILVLDMKKLVCRENPLLAIQYCGEGRVKDICPLFDSSKYTPRLRAVCSLEYYNEISGLLMTWEYHHHYDIANRSEALRNGSSVLASELSMPSSTSSVESSLLSTNLTEVPDSVFSQNSTEWKQESKVENEELHPQTNQPTLQNEAKPTAEAVPSEQGSDLLTTKPTETEPTSSSLQQTPSALDAASNLTEPLVHNKSTNNSALFKDSSPQSEVTLHEVGVLLKESDPSVSLSFENSIPKDSAFAPKANANVEEVDSPAVFSDIFDALTNSQPQEESIASEASKDLQSEKTRQTSTSTMISISDVDVNVSLGDGDRLQVVNDDQEPLSSAKDAVIVMDATTNSELSCVDESRESATNRHPRQAAQSQTPLHSEPGKLFVSSTQEQETVAAIPTEGETEPSTSDDDVPQNSLFSSIPSFLLSIASGDSNEKEDCRERNNKDEQELVLDRLLLHEVETQSSTHSSVCNLLEDLAVLEYEVCDLTEPTKDGVNVHHRRSGSQEGSEETGSQSWSVGDGRVSTLENNDKPVPTSEPLSQTMMSHSNPSEDCLPGDIQDSSFNFSDPPIHRLCKASGDLPIPSSHNHNDVPLPIDELLVLNEKSSVPNEKNSVPLDSLSSSKGNSQTFSDFEVLSLPGDSLCVSEENILTPIPKVPSDTQVSSIDSVVNPFLSSNGQDGGAESDLEMSLHDDHF